MNPSSESQTSASQPGQHYSQVKVFNPNGVVLEQGGGNKAGLDQFACGPFTPPHFAEVGQLYTITATPELVPSLWRCIKSGEVGVFEVMEG